MFASKGMEDLTGYPADEFTSRRLNYADIMLPEDRPATREAVFTALRERRMYEAERPHPAQGRLDPVDSKRAATECSPRTAPSASSRA